MLLRSIVILSVLLGTRSLEADIHIEVRAGGHDREACPVTMRIPKSMQQEKHFRLVRDDTQAEVPVQRFGPKRARRLMWMVQERLKAGEKRRYVLSSSDQRRTQQLVTCEDDGQRLKLAVQDTPVLHFNHGIVEAPEGIDSIYRRSGYIHPVMTPKGATVTGDFEEDHPHQHGVFFAWVNTAFRDQPADFWNQAKRQGGVEFQRFRNRRISGPVFAQFTATLSHFAIQEEQQIPVLEETWSVRVLHSRKPFVVEFSSRQKPVTEDHLEVSEHRYGGFAVRGPSEWLQTKSSKDAESGFLTSSGRTREDGNHTRARWVEMHGPLGSEHAGIIVLSAQDNFRAPQTVRLHPSKPYFCYAPMVLGAFRLEPGETYTSRYRLVIHDGQPDPKLAERMWQDYAHPPQVTILEPTNRGHEQ